MSNNLNPTENEQIGALIIEIVPHRHVACGANGCSLPRRQAEATAAIRALLVKAMHEQAVELMHEGYVKTLIGTYPTGEDKYSYSLDNAEIGAAVRRRVLELSGEITELEADHE